MNQSINQSHSLRSFIVALYSLMPPGPHPPPLFFLTFLADDLAPYVVLRLDVIFLIVSPNDTGYCSILN